MIITDIVALRERGKYIGMLALVSAVASVAGIVMGGAISERATWRL
jgi:MFS family permease